MVDIERPLNPTRSNTRKVKSLEQEITLPILSIVPKNNQGRNGDMVIVVERGAQPLLYFKANNFWHSSFSVQKEVKKRVVGPVNQQNNPTSAAFDTGWFKINDGGDTNILSPHAGNYQITHNLSSDFVTTQVYCRFEGIRNGTNDFYVIDLNSHISNSGPNSNRYGYWINMMDKNTIELNINPDGLSIIHGEILADSSNNTSTLISSSDSTNVGAIELRVFASPLIGKNNRKITMETPKSDGSLTDTSSKNRISTGDSVVNNLGATVDGTKNDSFAIDSDGTGVLLKNDSGALKIRNLEDSADAQIKASKLLVSAEAAATNEIGKSSVSNKFLSTHDGSAVYNAMMMSVSGVSQGNAAGGNVIFLDNQFMLADNADNTKTCIFQLSGIGSGTGRTLTVPNADGTIALTSDIVTNHITNDAADIMAVSDFGANAALELDFNQPATPGAEDSVGLHIDYDRIVAGSGTANHNDIGIDLDVNSATLGTGIVTGMDIDVVGATSGTHTAVGINLDVDSADTNIGMIINTAGTHLRLEANADPANDYATIAVADTGDLTIVTKGDGTTDSDLLFDIDGDIRMDADGGDIRMDATTITIDGASVKMNATKKLYLDGNTLSPHTHISETSDDVVAHYVGGDRMLTLNESTDTIVMGATNWIAGTVSGATITEFSAANSAYAGMILGYTDIGLDEARQTYTLTTSYVVPTDEFSVSFKAPPSGNVEIMISVCFNSGSSGAGDLYAGLSTANATSGYAQLADFHEEELIDQSGRYGRDTVQNYWTLTGLTAGTSYEYWVGFKSSSTTGTPEIEYGGNASGHNPDFIMKATALPATITT